jgi:hypothetical protein
MCRQHMIPPAIALRCLSGLRQHPPGMQAVLPRARQAQPLAPSTSSGFLSSALLRQLRDHPLFSALSYSEGIGLFLGPRARHSTKVWQLMGHRQLTVSTSHDFIGALPHTGAVKLRQGAQLGSTSSQNNILGVSVVATGRGGELSARMSGRTKVRKPLSVPRAAKGR